MRNEWTPEREGHLLRRVTALQMRQMNMRNIAAQLAEEFETSIAAIEGKYYKILAKQQAVELPESRYPVWDQPFTIPGDCLVLGDAHIPYHHAGFISACIRLALGLGIEQVLMGGDALDLHGLSSFPDNFEPQRPVIEGQTEARLRAIAESLPADSPQRAELLQELDDSVDDPHNVSSEWATARETLTALAKNFKAVYWTMGNHEHRLIRKLERVVTSVDLKALFCGDNPKFVISEYYWAVIESGGTTWQVEHPNLTAKGGSKRLAQKYHHNIIMLHNHQFSVQTDASGKFLAVESGGCMDERRMTHVAQRHNAADQHVLGAVIIKDGYPVLLNRYLMPALSDEQETVN